MSEKQAKRFAVQKVKVQLIRENSNQMVKEILLGLEGSQQSAKIT